MGSDFHANWREWSHTLCHFVIYRWTISETNESIGSLWNPTYGTPDCDNQGLCKHNMITVWTGYLTSRALITGDNSRRNTRMQTAQLAQDSYDANLIRDGQSDLRVQHVWSSAHTVNGIQLILGKGIFHVIVIAEIEHFFGHVLHFSFQWVREGAVPPDILVLVAIEETTVGSPEWLLSDLGAGARRLLILLVVYLLRPRLTPGIGPPRLPEQQVQFAQTETEREVESPANVGSEPEG